MPIFKQLERNLQKRTHVLKHNFIQPLYEVDLIEKPRLLLQL